jgi:hypothetical protein
MRYVLVILVALPLLCWGQENLVPNGDFENYSSCIPNSVFQIGLATPWYNPTPPSSPDYYNACCPPTTGGDPHFGVPENMVGVQEAHSSDGYAGIFCYVDYQVNGREFLQVPLTECLVGGVDYEVSFYASLADKFMYAISSLGAHLSDNALLSSGSAWLEAVPQIVNPSGVILNDKESWTRISGVYNSRDGGECFITIGNFIVDTESNLTFVDSGATPAHNKSYYYIDDVSVIALDSIPSGVDEEEAKARMAFKAYPNPNSGSFQLDYSLFEKEKGIVEIHDAIGRLILSQQLQAEGSRMVLTLDVENQGLYILSVRIDGQLRYSEKLNITK